MKDRLLAWVTDQWQLDVVSKFILRRLAEYADGDGCAWSKVDTLAYEVNVSERTVQCRLRKLQDDGLIARTDRSHRLGTRDVPIYQVAPGLDFSPPRRPERDGSMGAKSAPIDEAWVQGAAPVWVQAVAPVKDQIRPEESVDTLSERARAPEGGPGQGGEPPRTVDERGLFEALIAEWGGKAPDRVSPTRCRVAWLAEILTAAPLDLLAAARRYLADGAGEVSRGRVRELHAWLAEQRYRPWLTAPDRPGEAAAARTAFVEGEVRQAVVDAAGEPFAKSYLDPCRWDAAARTLQPAFSRSGERLKAALTAEAWAELGVTFLPAAP